MHTYENPREIRRRVKEAANRADEQLLSPNVHRRSWLKDFGREVFIELPNTLLLGLPKLVRQEAQAEAARKRKDDPPVERDHETPR